jgi:hypothetical protein
VGLLWAYCVHDVCLVVQTVRGCQAHNLGLLEAHLCFRREAMSTAAALREIAVALAFAFADAGSGAPALGGTAAGSGAGSAAALYVQS